MPLPTRQERINLQVRADRTYNLLDDAIHARWIAGEISQEQSNTATADLIALYNAIARVKKYLG